MAQIEREREGRWEGGREERVIQECLCSACIIHVYIYMTCNMCKQCHANIRSLILQRPLSAGVSSQPLEPHWIAILVPAVMKTSSHKTQHNM